MSRRFRTPKLPRVGERTALDKEASHHLLHVLMVPRGETVTLFDGGGNACSAALVGVDGEHAIVEGKTAPVTTSATCEIVLLQAVCKGQAFERAVRMATELGVTKIIPVLTDRCVAKGDRAERWTRIMESAAAQSGRADLPELESVQPFATVITRSDLPANRLVGVPGTPAAATAQSTGAALLVGPEGGLTPKEIDTAKAAGFEPVGLGPYILRAETATAAILARYAMA